MKILPSADNPFQITRGVAIMVEFEFSIKEILLITYALFEGVDGRRSRRTGNRWRHDLVARLVITPVIVELPWLGTVRWTLLAIPDLTFVHGWGEVKFRWWTILTPARGTRRLVALLRLLLLVAAKGGEAGEGIRVLSLLWSWRGGGRGGVLLCAAEVAEGCPFVEEVG